MVWYLQAVSVFESFGRALSPDNVSILETPGMLINDETLFKPENTKRRGKTGSLKRSFYPKCYNRRKMLRLIMFINLFHLIFVALSPSPLTRCPRLVLFLLSWCYISFLPSKLSKKINICLYQLVCLIQCEIHCVWGKHNPSRMWLGKRSPSRRQCPFPSLRSHQAMD